MKVEVRAFPVHNDNVRSILANIDITLDESIVIRATLREGKEDCWVAFPQRSYTDKDGSVQYIDMAFPVNKEMREEITKKACRAFADAQVEEEAPAPKKKYYKK